ncbi:SLC13 family permease [Devosia sp.]|uniref:SLC13 family permease n=1 Tax=Devosia sp. TaxID=1871048 RepID=UPI002EF84B50
MTTPQLLSLLVIGLMMVGFVSNRLRYDVVAVVALLASVVLGIVPADKAFSGFSDDIVVIVGSALVVSGAIARSGILDLALQRIALAIDRPRAQLVTLVVAVTALSAFVKNIGALAIMMPIAFQMARGSRVSPSMFLMPMAFGSLLGGLMTQIGTSPNIIVSRIREELTGASFAMFDFTPVGAVLAVVGVAFLATFHWLLPERRKAESGLDEAIAIKNYMTEARVTETSAVMDKTVSSVQKLGGGRAMVTGIIGDNGRRRTPFPDAKLRVGDILLMEGEPDALDKMVALGGLSLSNRMPVDQTQDNEAGSVEAVIGQNSLLVGMTAQELALFDRTGVNVLAVSRRDKRFTERLGQIRFENGDVIVLHGNQQRLPEVLRELDCLPLVRRSIRLGSIRRGLLPLAILVGAVAAATTGLLPVAVAFFAAAALMVLVGTLPLRDVYEQLEPPILVMLAALIPVADSLRTTGATDQIAGWLSTAAQALPAWGAVGLILVAAMAVTPFLNNAAAVLVMAPIAAAFATGLGYRPEAFLMAVAIGAGCDFLTPIGHQCNTLVMGPGGYRFGDYARLGLPLSILVILVATPMLLLVWPV